MDAPSRTNDLLFALQQDFRRFGPLFAEMVEEVLRSGVTRYPVLVAARQTLGVGVPAPVGRNQGASFDYRLSFAEELIHKGVIQRDRSEAFKLQHRNTLGRACVLLVQDDESRFIFLPFDYSDAPELAQNIQ